MLSRTETLALLHFYVALGLDEATEAAPIDRRRLDAPMAPAPAPAEPEIRAPTRVSTPRDPAPATASRPAPRAFDPQQAMEAAEKAAAACQDLAALEAAVRSFDGCALKATAMSTVFADGPADSPVMFLGQAPGTEDDRLAAPFVGDAGMLLDRMLEAIGLERERVYTTNVVFWRPPGDRTPTATELAVCLPFVRRHIALKRPRLVILGGATAAQTVLGSELSLGRLRQKWHELALGDGSGSAPAIVTYNPAFLVLTPDKKRDAWMDFLRLKMKLRELSILT
jgi:DNA polymerase